MKQAHLILRRTALSLGFALSLLATQNANAVYCEAQCGRVLSIDYGGPFTEATVPLYQSCGVASASGRSIKEAFERMQYNCTAVGCFLHSGFDIYSNVRIRLNLNVVPSLVCN